jgi:hypothetical protein
MMVYIMHFYKKLSVLLGMMCWLLIAVAAENSLSVDYASLDVKDDAYVLNASFSVSFDEVIEEAINKGVPLSFLIEFQVVEPRKYWFDDEIITISKRIDLSYHALTKQYLVTRDGHQKSFASLSEARIELSQVKDWKVLPKSQLEKGARYQAAILMRLDKSKLPKAIQVDSISSDEWSLASTAYRWPVKEPKY